MSQALLRLWTYGARFTIGKWLSDRMGRKLPALLDSIFGSWNLRYDLIVFSYARTRCRLIAAYFMGSCWID